MPWSPEGRGPGSGAPHLAWSPLPAPSEFGQISRWYLPYRWYRSGKKGVSIRGVTLTMSQLLQQDSSNSQPIRRSVSGHNTGVADDPRVPNVVPTMMRLPPVGMDVTFQVDVLNGHPVLLKPHMQERAADPTWN
jgi:hypothetical protein